MKNFIQSQTLLAVLLISVALDLRAQDFEEIAKVVSSDRMADDYFGSAVDVSGHYAIVGEICDGLCKGAAYILEKDESGNWSVVQKLVASDGTDNDIFGAAVSIDGDRAIVTAYNQDKNASGGGYKSNAGAAYIYERNNEGIWVQQQKIVASDRAEGDQLGRSASISGNYAIVGSNFDDHDADGNSYAESAGSAYIFKRDESTGVWAEVQKIVASDRSKDDWFGSSVAISGDYAIVGAYWQQNRKGAAYIYKKDEGGSDNWGEIKKLEATDLVDGDWFGVSVDIDGPVAVATAYNDDVIIGASTIEQSGSAFVFHKDQGGADNWGLVQKLSASDATQYDTFGRSVSISGDLLVIGASGEGNSEVEYAGAAYVFHQNAEGNWNEVQKLVASDRDSNDSFGDRVGISGNHVVITAPFESHDENGANFMENAGSSYIFELIKGEQTITFNALADKTYNDSPFLLSADATSDLPVSFSVVSGPATLNGNEVTITGVGDVTIKASQEGNDFYLPADPVEQAFTVTKAEQVIGFEVLADKTYGDAPFLLNASATSDLPVSFSVVSGPATLNDNEVTITGVGDVTIKASQEGNDFYLPADPVEQTFTVAKADQTITFDPLPANINQNSPDFEISASSSSGLAVRFEASNDLVSIMSNTVSVVGSGEVTITATQQGNENYHPAEPVSRVLVIEGVLSANDQQLSDTKLYPNPATHSFKIDWQETSGYIQVIDMNGSAVINKKYQPNQSVLVTDLVRGPYIVVLKDSSGEILQSLRLIKK